MTPEEFSKFVDKKASELKNYAVNRFPSKAGDIALRFINGNFRAQGFQGTTFKKWKENQKGTTILIGKGSGKLRSANYYTTQNGQVTIKNPMPYAKVHNEGFNGTVSIKAHKRNRYQKVKTWTGRTTKIGKSIMKNMTVKSGEGNVKAHTRKMNIEQRQFIPTVDSPSPVLNNAVLREVARDINQIMNQ